MSSKNFENKTLVVIPAYNENNNIRVLINEIFEISPFIYILVVDDSKEDKISSHILNKKFFYIKRNSKLGRGSAIIVGFKWGFKNKIKFDSFIEMDADFSHNPKDINIGLNHLNNYDFVIGSRYPDGRIINWPISRLIFSKLSNYLIRFLISYKIKDYTNGFRFYKRQSVKDLLNSKIVSYNFIMLSETASILLKNNRRVFSFPITFVNRKKGNSNFNLKEVILSLYYIFIIAWKYNFSSFKK